MAAYISAEGGKLNPEAACQKAAACVIYGKPTHVSIFQYFNMSVIYNY